ncbi:hypothetical protein SADUNF_Sadunf07G0088800 [Salix dunnii]|uniref:Uncharacterized protein n=1 Tax=Salix dunnii TaxID=1413687 RepID=A0A835K1A2_9ROSI|nr:hypothetical protein SADUNF_Sadunf07G0088800 [Salix dunnii]
MPVEDPTSGRVFIWLISFFLFITIAAGGSLLLMYVLLPADPSRAWFPVAGGHPKVFNTTGNAATGNEPGNIENPGADGRQDDLEGPMVMVEKNDSGDNGNTAIKRNLSASNSINMSFSHDFKRTEPVICYIEVPDSRYYEHKEMLRKRNKPFIGDYRTEFKLKIGWKLKKRVDFKESKQTPDSLSILSSPHLRWIDTDPTERSPSSKHIELKYKGCLEYFSTDETKSIHGWECFCGCKFAAHSFIIHGRGSTSHQHRMY